MSNLAVVRPVGQQTIQLDRAIWEKVFDTINYFDEVLKDKTMSDSMMDDGYSMCLPLCDEFFHGIPVCSGCPVRAKTGRAFCRETPIDDFLDHWEDWHVKGGIFGYGKPRRKHPAGEIGIECDRCESHIRDEIDFLKSLFFGKTERKTSWLGI